MFSFSNVSVADIKKEIRERDPRKATQNIDIPVGILKQNSDIFGNYTWDFFNECVDNGAFSSILKNAKLHLFLKKILKDQKTIIGWWLYFQLYLKYLRNSYQNK